MRWWLVIVFWFTAQAGFAQENTCDSVYYRTFYNFVHYNDSVGYSLNYKIDAEHHDCLEDTVSLINFLLSDTYEDQRHLAHQIENGPLMGRVEYSYLAHHTDHKLVPPLADTSWKYLSVRSAQRVGEGRQLVRPAPVRVLKLYFVEALFHDDFQFKNEIVLTDGKRTVEIYTEEYPKEEEAESRIYKLKIRHEKVLRLGERSLSKWQTKLNEKGLDYLRKQNVSPLSLVKGIEWRNHKNDPFGR